MKKVIFSLVFVATCFYFLSAGSLSFFSKLGKTTVTEILDFDEDAPDSEEKEAKDSKEDGWDEKDFLDLMHTALLSNGNIESELSFLDKSFLAPQHISEKTSPPPRA